MHPLIGFVFQFMTVQNILTAIIFPWYIGNFISDVEGGRTQMLRNGIFSYDFLKATSGYFPWYLPTLLSVYYFILLKNGSLAEAFLLGVTVCAVTDFAIFSMFSRTNIYHLPILMYDIFVVGGLGFAFSVYLWKNYKSIHSTYGWLFLATFLLSSALYCYVVYRVEITPYKAHLKS